MPLPSDSALKQLFDRSPIGMYRSTENGKFLHVNRALVELLGYATVDDLLAVNVNEDIYVDPQQRIDMIEKYRRRGVVDGALVQWKTRDGRRVNVRIFGHVIDEGGQASFDASVIDVTSIESTNAELQRTATTLDMVVRQVSAVYWLVDRDLRIQRTGGPIMEVLGYAPDHYVGTTLYDVHEVDPASENPIQVHLKALQGETSNYISDYRGRQLANTIAPYRVDGVIVGAIGTAVDVTAQRALERRMVDAQRAESLGILAGGLAHDFNNLLVAILGNADLGLRDTPPGAPGRSSLDNIRSASLRAAELTDQLLAYAGRGGVSAAHVAPAPIVDELLRISAPRMPANAVATVNIGPELMIRGDAGQLRQVVLNLISNAREALKEDGGTINVSGRLLRVDGSAHPDDVLTADAGTYVVLEVKDNGSGISEDARRRIFDPFFTTKATGHGLGLAAVLGIVRTHGGGLRLCTKSGVGATFQVLWPAATAGDGQEMVVPRVRHTVLVIDDEDLVRDVLARMIEDLGYTALTAADGIAGLDLVEHERIDAVLVDLTMPRMSGAEVVTQLRARRPALPIVLCTGYDRDRRGPVNADAYLPKPFRIEALEQTLAKLLGAPASAHS
ncbi:MAG: response regulator [Deltaproteobacteria bacterium]|nr:response regulator [Deltaproteobacteria bacterium]